MSPVNETISYDCIRVQLLNSIHRGEFIQIVICEMSDDHNSVYGALWEYQLNQLSVDENMTPDSLALS